MSEPTSEFAAASADLTSVEPSGSSANHLTSPDGSYTLHIGDDGWIRTYKNGHLDRRI